MDGAHDPYEAETYAMGENTQIENVETKLKGRRKQVTPLAIVENMRSPRVEL